MDERYADPTVSVIFSDAQKFYRWWQVTIEMMHARGLTDATAQAAADRAGHRPPPSVGAVKERERVTGHDVAGFLQAVDQEAQGDLDFRRHLHYGLTSSDLVDNAHHEALYAVTQRFIVLANELGGALQRQIKEHDQTFMLGRTHGQPAEPTTFGHRLEVFLQMLDRSRNSLRDVRRFAPVRKVPGAVGTRSLYDGPKHEDEVRSTQIIPRDIQAHWAFHAVELVNVCESIALEIRLLSNNNEVMEGGADRRVGSSAMPHKKNPIFAENICGLARVARGYLAPILETVPTFHDRDISNSSVERTAVVDLAHLTATITKRTAQLVRQLKVDKTAMRNNLNDIGNVIYSSLAVNLIQMLGYPYIQAHELVAEAAQTPEVFYTELVRLMNAENMDTITFNRYWVERANPNWMTRNVRRVPSWT